MTQLNTTLGRIARQLGAAGTLLIAATGTATAHGSGGMMSGGWGLLGGAMGLWGLLWMGLLFGVPLYLAYSLLGRRSDGSSEDPATVLRERYARGELSDDEFERRRDRLERAN